MAIDAQNLRTVGIYESRAPLQSVLDDLDQIGILLQTNEAQRGKLRRYAGLAMIVGVVSAIAASVIGINALGFCAFLGFAAGVGLFIYSFVAGRDMHKHRDRYDLMKELSGILRRDADMRARFSVRLALKAQPKLLKEEPFPARKNGKQKFFAEEFISIEGELLDGTVLHEDITELSRIRTFTNPRGKSKTKTRNRYLLKFRFAYPNEVYGNARGAQQSLHEAIRVPPSATLGDVDVSETAIAVKAKVQLEKEITQVTAMVCLGVYRILNLARRTVARGPGGVQGGA